MICSTFESLIDPISSDTVTQQLSEIILTITSNIDGLLKFTRTFSPTFTQNDLDHSWRILQSISRILKKQTLKSLSTVEIFSLIIAIIFHDVRYKKKEKSFINIVQNSQMLDDFFRNYCPAIPSLSAEDIVHVSHSISFIMASQAMTWQEMITSEYFKREIKIGRQNLRTEILTVFFKIGDLLDLDSSRNCNPLKRTDTLSIQENDFKNHLKNHGQVLQYLLDPEKISIIMEVQNKDEHIFWSEWFGYLKQNITHANSIFTGKHKHYQIPPVTFHIKKSSSANYDIWPLRFELDEKGRLWDIISQAVYTSRFDFLRELIQNAIDATLYKIYNSENANISSISPRGWNLDQYFPQVIIIYSEKEKYLEIIDNGIGMSKMALQNFLFKIARTGYNQIEQKRDFQFPAIAKFGIGFISILLSADKVIIKTKSQKNRSKGRMVTLKTEALDAYSEVSDCEPGTAIALFLKNRYPNKELFEYLSSYYKYPSVPVFYLNYDHFQNMIKVAQGLKISIPPILENLYTDKSRITTSIYFSEYQQQIQNITDLIKMELMVDDIENYDKSLQLDTLLLHIDTKNLNKNDHQAPSLMIFNERFEIIKMTEVDTKTVASVATGMIFIPVSFISYDPGIEWLSIHGFLILNNELVKSIIRYSGLANEFDDPDKTIMLSREELNDEDNYDSEKIIVDTVDVIRKLDLQRYNRHNEYDQYAEQFLTNDSVKIRLDEFDEFPTPFFDQKGIRIKNSTDKGTYQHFYQLIQEHDNNVYQDGIKIPVKAYSVAPFGMCRALLNLTGDARFELNVTRNSINESPTLISAWFSEYGSKIHKQIKAEIAKTCDQLKFRYNIRELIVQPDRSEHNILYNSAKELILKETNL